MRNPIAFYLHLMIDLPKCIIAKNLHRAKDGMKVCISQARREHIKNYYITTGKQTLYIHHTYIICTLYVQYTYTLEIYVNLL